MITQSVKVKNETKQKNNTQVNIDFIWTAKPKMDVNVNTKKYIHFEFGKFNLRID